MRNRFDLQLKQLNDDIIEMGNMMERAIEMGVYALIGHDTDKAKQTIDYDMDIDHMERDIEALCMKLLLQQQPGTFLYINPHVPVPSAYPKGQSPFQWSRRQ